MKGFTWNKVSIEQARILSEARFSARETAAAIGATRNSCISRSSRKGEFNFSCTAYWQKHDAAVDARRVAKARQMIEHVTEEWVDAQPPRPPRPPKPAEPCNPSPISISLPKQKFQTDFANLARMKKLKEQELVSRETPPEGSVPFHELKKSQCHWIVGTVDGLDTPYCGKPVLEGTSYCDHHLDLRKSKIQPKTNVSALARIP
jgi:hypothetical protein